MLKVPTNLNRLFAPKSSKKTTRPKLSPKPKNLLLNLEPKNLYLIEVQQILQNAIFICNDTCIQVRSNTSTVFMLNKISWIFVLSSHHHKCAVSQSQLLAKKAICVWSGNRHLCPPSSSGRRRTYPHVGCIKRYIRLPPSRILPQRLRPYHHVDLVWDDDRTGGWSWISLFLIFFLLLWRFLGGMKGVVGEKKRKCYWLVGFCSAVQLLIKAWHGSSSVGATPRFELFLIMLIICSPYT